MTQNQIAYAQNVIRANELAEKARSNRENEKIKALEADTARKLAVYQAYNLQRQGDAAGTQKWLNAVKTAATPFEAVGKMSNLIGG